MEVLVLVGEVVDFQLLEQFFDRRVAGEEGRDDDHRAGVFGHALLRLHARQQARGEQVRHVPVEHAQREVAGRDEREQREAGEHGPARAAPVGDEAERRDDERREEPERAEVEEGRVAQDRAHDALARARAVTEDLFEPDHVVADEVVADVRARGLRRRPRGRVGGQPQRAARHFQFVRAGALRDALDDVAVAVARVEVHARVDARRVFAEQRIDEAHRLEEVAPVERREQPHRGDDVADGDLGGGLPLVFEVDGLLGGEPALVQPALQPVEDGHERRVLVAQALRELDDEGAVEVFVLAEAPGEQRGQRLGLPPDRLQQLVGERVRLLARRARRDDARGEAAHVLHQREAQRDGDGPQLADGERRRLLVGADEPPQCLRVEAAVGVRDERERDGVDARVVGEFPRGELGQFVVKTLGQVFADFAQLLLDDVEVIDQPLGGGRDGAPLAHRLGERAVGVDEHAPVLLQPRQEPPPAPPAGVDAVLGRQRRRVLLQALDAVQLVANRLLIASLGRTRETAQ